MSKQWATRLRLSCHVKRVPAGSLALPTHCPSNRRSFRWVSDIRDLKATGTAGVDCVPVVCPPQPHRRERWERILAWYGLTHSSENTPSTAVPQDDAPRADRSDDYIVALGERCAAVASVLAEVDGRPLLRATRVREIPAVLTDGRARSV